LEARRSNRPESSRPPPAAGSDSESPGQWNSQLRLLIPCPEHRNDRDFRAPLRPSSLGVEPCLNCPQQFPFFQCAIGDHDVPHAGSGVIEGDSHRTILSARANRKGRPDHGAAGIRTGTDQTSAAKVTTGEQRRLTELNNYRGLIVTERPCFARPRSEVMRRWKPSRRNASAAGFNSVCDRC
jgi:hypothetical protein